MELETDVHIKEEPLEQGSCESDALALYGVHEIKQELDIGPAVLQQSGPPATPAQTAFGVQAVANVQIKEERDIDIMYEGHKIKQEHVIEPIMQPGTSGTRASRGNVQIMKERNIYIMSEGRNIKPVELQQLDPSVTLAKTATVMQSEGIVQIKEERNVEMRVVDLYEGHEIKPELVIGPVVLRQPCLPFTLAKTATAMQTEDNVHIKEERNVDTMYDGHKIKQELNLEPLELQQQDLLVPVKHKDGVSPSLISQPQSSEMSSPEKVSDISESSQIWSKSKIPLYVEGMLSICKSCDYRGLDFRRCQRCKRQFKEEPKSMPMTCYYNRKSKKRNKHGIIWKTSTMGN